MSTGPFVAPEVMAGESPTTAADVYALGVLLYQLFAGDFRKPLAPGWEADIADPLVRQDIAESACGDPARRLRSAAELAEHLANLDQRRAERKRLEDEQRRREIAVRRRASWYGRPLRWAMGGAVLLAALFVGLAVYRKGLSPAPKMKTVAVLPFQNSDSDASLDFLRLALPDEIATTLSGIHGLAIRPFSASSRYEQSNFDPQKAGREMHVSSVVTGHFLRANDQMNITLEAIDVASDRVIWSDEIHVPAQSMIATQMQIGLLVRGGLAPAFGVTAPESAPPPKNEQAYALFLRGLSLDFNSDSASNEQAIRLLEMSTKLDPTYAPAWQRLARHYYIESRFAKGDPALMDQYVNALEKAVALDPNYVSAGALLIVAQVERGDLINAYQRAQELVRRHADSVDAHFALSYVLRFAGLLHESADQCDAAFLLHDPTEVPGLRSCAITFLELGNYPRALTYVQLDLGTDWAKAFTIDVLVREGKIQEALKLGPPNVPQWTSYNMLQACLQHRSPADIQLLAAKVQPSGDPEANYLSAVHLAYCGQAGASLGLLKRAIEGNYCSYPAIDSDPFWANLQSDPRFAQIRAAAVTCQQKFLAQRNPRVQKAFAN